MRVEAEVAGLLETAMEGTGEVMPVVVLEDHVGEGVGAGWVIRK